MPAAPKNNDLILLQVGGWTDQQQQNQPMPEQHTNSPAEAPADTPPRTPEEIAADACDFTADMERRPRERQNENNIGLL